MKTLKFKRKTYHHVDNPIKVYDIEVDGAHHYTLKNGVVSHNSMSFIPTTIQASGCLLSDTQVVTQESGNCAIKDIVTGMHVMSHDGEWHEVTKTWIHEKPTYTIEFDDDVESLTCSDTHRFLVNIEHPELDSSWKTAEELEDGDEVYMLDLSA